MRVIRFNSICRVVILLSIVLNISCLKDDDYTIMLPQVFSYASIPSDNSADPNPTVNNPNTTIPNINYTVEEDGGHYIFRIDLPGIQIPGTSEWLRLKGSGYGQNVWLEVDGNPKGIVVYNNIDNYGYVDVIYDFVFLVDNSGSMSDEADAIARDIVNWASKLNSMLDVRFGVVGYDGRITGAIDMTSYSNVASYLNRKTGTSRTVGFEGTYASYLSGQAYYYNLAQNNECGMAALLFADNLFTFRDGASRIYVNFTDESNMPQGRDDFSVAYLAYQSNWNTSQGTVHTVFSGSTSITEQIGIDEKPWRMSEYTGGTVLYANSSFSNVSLDNLPVTSAMENSYVIKFTNADELLDGRTHQIKITIKTGDGKVQATKVFYVNF